MDRISKHLRRNAVAYVALFVALGGSSYAAFRLPAGSVGTPQLENHSVTPIKFSSKVGAYVRAWAEIQGGTKVIAARPRARVVEWDPASASGVVTWGRSISRSCFPLTSGSGDLIQAALLPLPGRIVGVHYAIYNNAGQLDDNGPLTFVAALCPDP